MTIENKNFLAASLSLSNRIKCPHYLWYSTITIINAVASVSCCQPSRDLLLLLVSNSVMLPRYIVIVRIDSHDGVGGSLWPQNFRGELRREHLLGRLATRPLFSCGGIRQG